MAGKNKDRDGHNEKATLKVSLAKEVGDNITKEQFENDMPIVYSALKNVGIGLS